MARPVEDPVETIDPNDPSKSRITHPSYAVIGASRVSGMTSLHGSDFMHQNYVTVTISSAEVDRHLSNDWTHGRRELIEVAMSEAQWATFVSSMNIGSGVPCTLQHVLVAGQIIPRLPDPPDRRERFAAELAANNKEALKSLEALTLLIMDSKLSGTKQTEMLKKVRWAEREIGSSSKFVADQFDEHMESTVEKAKIEVNAYAIRKLTSLGMDAIGLDAPITLGITHDEDM